MHTSLCEVQTTKAMHIIYVQLYAFIVSLARYHIIHPTPFVSESLD